MNNINTILAYHNLFYSLRKVLSRNLYAPESRSKPVEWHRYADFSQFFGLTNFFGGAIFNYRNHDNDEFVDGEARDPNFAERPLLC